MPSPLQIPTVTTEDLYAFHARIFSSSDPRQRFSTEQESHSDTIYEEVPGVQNDDLGIYPDGVKRTLTDDQIAMFRHSEIYSILRERQVRKENLEAEGGDQSESIGSQPEKVVKATTSSDEEGEVQSEGEINEVFATVPETAPQHTQATHAEKKWKRGDTSTSYMHGKKHASRSARGFVRELDSAVAEDQILDYGDEPSIVEGSKINRFAVTEVADQGRAEGRKIWWPIIEAT